MALMLTASLIDSFGVGAFSLSLFALRSIAGLLVYASRLLHSDGEGVVLGLAAAAFILYGFESMLQLIGGSICDASRIDLLPCLVLMVLASLRSSVRVFE